MAWHAIGKEKDVHGRHKEDRRDNMHKARQKTGQELHTTASIRLLETTAQILTITEPVCN